MTWGLVLQAVVVGLASGAVVGLVAIGFTLVYRLTAVLQFAHGDLVGAAAFVAMTVATGSTAGAQLQVSGARYAAAVGATLVFGAVSGAIVYALVRAFTERAQATGWIGVTIALSFAAQGALASFFPREAYVVPDALPFARWAPLGLPGGASLPPRTLWIMAAGVALALGARAFLRRSLFGVALEAIAEDPLAARAAGMPVRRLVLGAFMFAGALAGAAALLGSPAGRTIATGTGVILGVKAIAASVLGGLRDPHRVFGAALALGVVESVVTSLHLPGLPWFALGPAWRDIAPVLVVILVLAFRSARAAVEAEE